MIQQLLNEHVLDPKNTEKLFKLAKEYDRLEQGAMSVSLYLKTADLSESPLMQYKCMLGLALSYERQGNRRYTVEGALLDAVSILPERPEAYYLLSKFYAEGQAWKQSYFFAHTGLTVCSEEKFEDIGVGYRGIKSLEVKKAVAKWQITGQQDGKKLLFDLKFKNSLEKEDRQTVSYMLSNIGYPEALTYTSDDFNRFKFLFPGLERIHENYSKHFQDLFVLTVLKGKKNGTYIELGANDPYINSNTALLEKEFDWKGISIDPSQSTCYKFKEDRRNTVICADIPQIGFADLFDKHCIDNTVDYLQINCGESSVDVLKSIPLDKYKFGVVTLNHDSYRLGPDRRDEMRSILKDRGYILVVKDVAFTEVCSYEDWYVHPDLVEIDPRMISKKDVNFVWDYFMHEDFDLSEF